MFATPAYAQAANGAANGGGGPFDLLMMAPLLLVFVLYYFLLIRPQQNARKKQAEKLGAIKRNDTVVLNSGVIGKVTRVEDAEVSVEISPNVEVKVVKSMVADVRVKGQPVPANDTKR